MVKAAYDHVKKLYDIIKQGVMVPCGAHSYMCGYMPME